MYRYCSAAIGVEQFNFSAEKISTRRLFLARISSTQVHSEVHSTDQLMRFSNLPLVRPIIFPPDDRQMEKGSNFVVFLHLQPLISFKDQCIDFLIREQISFEI